MTPEDTGKTTHDEREQLRDFFYDLVVRVAEEEKFDVEMLEPKFEEYFTEIDPSQGDRCVDGRPVLEKAGNEDTGFKGEDYKGAQIPGGTLGELDVLKKITGFDEDKAREVIKKTYEDNGLRMGAHIDDGHGDIKSLNVLRERKIGCGDQIAKQKHLLRMYSHQPFAKTLYEERLGWIKAGGGQIFPLSGSHDENLAAINLIENSTFDTFRASGKEDSVFNCDVAEIHRRAGMIYKELADTNSLSRPMTKEDFQKSFTETTVRNYFQTLVALDQRALIYVRK